MCHTALREVVDPDAVICVSNNEAKLEIELTLECLSTSQRDPDFRCEAALNGTDVVVSSTLLFDTRGNDRLADCQVESTTCTIDLTGPS